jgi:hypothetical protein
MLPFPQVEDPSTCQKRMSRVSKIISLAVTFCVSIIAGSRWVPRGDLERGAEDLGTDKLGHVVEASRSGLSKELWAATGAGFESSLVCVTAVGFGRSTRASGSNREFRRSVWFKSK